MALSRAQLVQVNSARTVGGTPSVYLSNAELAFLLCVVAEDLGLEVPAGLPCADCLKSYRGFYEQPLGAMHCPQIAEDTDGNQLVGESLAEMMAEESDVFTYFWALTSLHAQRRKFRAILDYQPIPELETVIPRGLLSLGDLPADALAAWLVWRKFIYDIDNRAAQTTGYLFEPILAGSIGGASYSAARSPIRRKGTGRGRQVDCILHKNAYEFKMRVTLAASGQGRFAEELSFAEDCHLSGYRPVLLVLDPTPSARLSELSTEFRSFNGEAYTGDTAWEHLEQQAGPLMSQFLERYVRGPITLIDKGMAALPRVTLAFDAESNSVYLTIGGRQYRLR